MVSITNITRNPGLSFSFVVINLSKPFDFPFVILMTVDFVLSY
jgi:hypothetical protein